METPNEKVLGEIKKLVKASTTEMRPLVIVTEGQHSKHYSLSSENEATKDLFSFTNLDGQRLLIPWDGITYLGLCPAIAAIAVARGAGGGK